MAGSTLGNLFSITTWGESHGEGVGVVIDGCPAGLTLTTEEIQNYLNKRKPGQTKYSTQRKESDEVSILSGMFEGRTTGTPISLMVKNTSQRSSDYGELSDVYRPGHADFTFEKKYGFRDYRGGGRASGRETIGRVAAGAIALKILEELGISILTYTKSIGSIRIKKEAISIEDIEKSPLRMPDREASLRAEEFLCKKIEEKDSVGGIIECVVSGMRAGIGEPVFSKLDAALAGNVFSIGAVKGVEIGEGFAVSQMTGSQNNDSFCLDANGNIRKATNFAGGILGGISDGSDIVLRAAIKPTPSIFKEQNTLNQQKEKKTIEIAGRHDPIIVPRAVVVVESMVAITVVEQIFMGMSSRIDKIKDFFTNE